MTNARRRNDPPEERNPNNAVAGATPVAFAPNVSRRTGPLQGLTDPALKAVGGPPVAGQQRGFRTLMRNRYFLRLWLAQLISQTIMNAANYALIIVTQRSGTGSFTAAAGAIVAFSLPALLFGAPAGVLVDRFDRRLVLWVSNLLRAIASIVFVFVLMVDSTPLLPVYIIAFFIALVGQFFAPAEGAAIPQLVRKDELIHALSLFNITFTLAQAAGLIILGPLMLALIPTFRVGDAAHGVEFTSRETLFIVIAALYIVCIGLILSIPRARMKVNRQARNQDDVLFEPKEMSQVRRVYISILQTGNFIRKDRRLLISVGQLALGGSVVAVIAMIAPGFVEDFFHKPAELAALVFRACGRWAGAWLRRHAKRCPPAWLYAHHRGRGDYVGVERRAAGGGAGSGAARIWPDRIFRCSALSGRDVVAHIRHWHRAGLRECPGADDAPGTCA